MNKKERGIKPMKSTVFRLDPETHKALRIAAIEDGISMNEALTQAVAVWLKGTSQKGGEKMKDEERRRAPFINAARYGGSSITATGNRTGKPADRRKRAMHGSC